MSYYVHFSGYTTKEMMIMKMNHKWNWEILNLGRSFDIQPPFWSNENHLWGIWMCMCITAFGGRTIVPLHVQWSPDQKTSFEFIWYHTVLLSIRRFKKVFRDSLDSFGHCAVWLGSSMWLATNAHSIRKGETEFTRSTQSASICCKEQKWTKFLHDLPFDKWMFHAASVLIHLQF